MANVSICLYASDDSPVASTLTMSDGRRFVTTNLGDGVTVISPGLDGQSGAWARAFGESLLKAAAEIEAAEAVKASAAVSGSPEPTSAPVSDVRPADVPLARGEEEVVF